MPELLTVVRVPLTALHPNTRNPRTISDERFAALKQSLAADPDMLLARPIIALPDGTIIAGNMRALAALDLGWQEVPCVYADLDPDRAKTWMLRDNRPYGEDDEDLLAELLFELEQSQRDLLPLTGFNDEDLARLLNSVRGETKFKVDPDAVPPLPLEPRSQHGEVYELGGHLLYCGNALDAYNGVFAETRLDGVIADPPYGIALDTDYRSMSGEKIKNMRSAPSQSNVYEPVVGDDAPFDASSYAAAFAQTREQFWFGADYYRRTLSPDDRDGSWLVWDKRNESSDAGYGSGFELVWSRQRHKRDLLRFYFFGAFGVEGANRMHPTQKPTPLLAEIIKRWMPENGVVADPFSGSGSVLIACEQTGRVCLAAEVDQSYCDVIRQRYAEFTDRPDLAP